MKVDILLSVHNGMPYLRDQLASLQGQTHRCWRLWVRDDGSSDGSPELVREFAAADPRIQLLPSAGERLGASRSFGRLMEHVEADAPYTLLCDADDFWLPTRIERTLEAMRRAEAREAPGTPILVHTDLIVADAGLRPIHQSFWEYRKLRPEPATLRRLLFDNVVTGPTVMMNRPVVQLATPVPEGALYQDWWVALVAAAFGRVVALPTPTVLYRQHGRNSVGARPEAGAIAMARRALGALREPRGFSAALIRTARQAEAFLEKYGTRLQEADREWTVRFAELSRCGPLRRKVLALQLTSVAQQGGLRNVARALRA